MALWAAVGGFSASIKELDDDDDEGDDDDDDDGDNDDDSDDDDDGMMKYDVCRRVKGPRKPKHKSIWSLAPPPGM